MPALLASAPAQFYAGDTVRWAQASPEASPADGWTLTVALSGPSALEATATVEGGQFIVTLAAAQTAGLTAGTHTWAARVTRGVEAYTIASGVVVVLAAPATLGADGALMAERHLAAIEAVLSNRITADVESYQIAGRQLVKIPVDQLLKMRAMFAAEVRRARTGGRIGTPMLVQFTRTGAG